MPPTCLAPALLTLLAVAPAAPVAFAQDRPTTVPQRSNLGRTRPALKSATAAEPLALAVQTKRAIEARILTPDPELIGRERALLELPDTGFCRLQHRVRGETGWEDLILRRGGGTESSQKGG